MSQLYATDVVIWGTIIHHTSLFSMCEKVFSMLVPPVKSQQHPQVAPGEATVSQADKHS